MDIERFCCNILYENCWLASTQKACVLVDPGAYGPDELAPILRSLGGRVPDAILLTHGHFDHTLGVKPLQDLWPDVPVYMGPEDKVVLETDDTYARGIGLKGGDFSFRWLPVKDGQTLSFGDMEFRVITTPGHTPGGVCWYCEKEGVVFTGDTLFADAIGRTDFGYGDYDDEIRSIMEKLILLPGSTDVYPGHGRTTTIGRERTSNPFLEPFNEPGETFGEDLPGIELHGI